MNKLQAIKRMREIFNKWSYDNGLNEWYEAGMYTVICKIMDHKSDTFSEEVLQGYLQIVIDY